MNILVTGSTGFIGGKLCQALIAAGHRVRAFHRPTSSLKLLDGLPVEHALGDLTQPQTVRDAMQDIEAVFHVAALMSNDNPGKAYAITVEGSRAVMEAARQAGVRRLVHTSSVAALGVPEQGPGGREAPTLLDERHTWNYRPDFWAYGFAKYLAEMALQNAIAGGLDAVIVNPSVVFGAGDHYRAGNSTIVMVARGRLPLYTTGGINVVHIDDVVAGHIAALERGRCGERYILGGENLTIPQFIKLCAEIAGVKPPRLFLPAGLVRRLARPVRLLRSLISLPVSGNELRLAGRYFFYSTRKAQTELGLGSPRSARDALADAYQWYKDNGIL